ncbi:MAG TPA: cephalosporin hydroxylase family protein [Rhodocyclaceae bacterium]|nr:cephalosporin hydroxylase family protein [Rhodocyclaceae bacterium]
MTKISACPISDFEAANQRNIAQYKDDAEWQRLTREWIHKAFQRRYMYNFTCMGRPIIQTPIDMTAIQELIWKVKPDLVIETGIAHGGSLILSASMLALLDYCDAAETGMVLDPAKPKRRVLGVDIDIRAHNRKAIEEHPMASRIDMLEGSSIAPEITQRVHAIATDHKCVMAFLDSNHTHDHVLAELEAYAPLVSAGSYCVVFDTVVEDLPTKMYPDRPWDVGNNPKTAVREFLKHHPEFKVDEDIEAKLLITLAPGGYLRRV